MHRQSRSLEIYQTLCDVLPGGVNSPVRSFRSVNQSPMVAAKGVGDTIYDVDHHNYIDYCGSWGALIHGHTHPKIVEAARHQLELGSSFGITTEIEGKLAQKIQEDIPSIELLRFVSTGTEATMTAARIARGYTGKKTIVKFTGHYHGHADAFLVKAGSGVFGLTNTSTSEGIPAEFLKYTACLPFNDVQQLKDFLREYKQDIAAVILEPVAGNMGVVPADPEFIQVLREETGKIGALLIFDEVMCGYRVPNKTAQAMYDIKPDLTCLGKVIGGGFPVAAIGGKREIMEVLAPLGKVYQAGTLSGNPVAMAAGLATLELLQTPGIYDALFEKVKIITDPVQKYIEQQNIPVCVQSCGSLFNLFFGLKRVRNMEEASHLDLERFTKFFQYLYSQGVYISPSQYEAWFMSTVHSQDHLEYTRDLILQFLESEFNTKY